MDQDNITLVGGTSHKKVHYVRLLRPPFQLIHHPKAPKIMLCYPKALFFF